MPGMLLDCGLSDGGDDSKASDRDKDDGTVCCGTPPPNRKGGSRLSAEERRGISLVVWPFVIPGLRGMNFFFVS